MRLNYVIGKCHMQTLPEPQSLQDSRAVDNNSVWSHHVHMV